MIQELTAEQIEKNFDKFQTFLERTGDRAEPIKKMLEEIGERLALAPASSRVSYHNCFPGGLVDHSLRVLANALKLKKAFDWEFSNESLIISCLFHDLGKVGDDMGDHYIRQESDWHRDKLGQLYEINKEITYMTVSHRSIWLLQHYGIELSKDEFMGILLNDGQYVDENRPYKNGETALALLVHIADNIASKQEKGLFT